MDRRQKTLNGGTIAFVAVLILILADGCATSQREVVKTPQRALVLSKCGACHLLPDADSVRAAAAKKIMRDHGSRVDLTAAENEYAVDYLTTSD